MLCGFSIGYFLIYIDMKAIINRIGNSLEHHLKKYLIAFEPGIFEANVILKENTPEKYISKKN